VGTSTDRLLLSGKLLSVGKGMPGTRLSSTGTFGDKAGWPLGIPGGNDDGVAVGGVEVNRLKIADTHSASSSVLLLGCNVGNDNELSVGKETSGEPVASWCQSRN